MGKIYIYGNEQSQRWGTAIGEICSFPTITINNYSAIHDFVVNNLKNLDSDSRIVIDLDAIDPALALTTAMHIRLSVVELKTNAFVPILLVSNLPLLTFLSLGECSQFFLAQVGYAFCLPDEAQFAVKEIKDLNIDNYTDLFLEKIQIHPDAAIGTHSMANQWGADVLNRIISKEDSVITDEIAKAKKMLYYKYIYVNTVPIKDIIADTKEKEYRRNEMCPALQKKILLIDDEANKGWSDVLKKWLYKHLTFDVVNRQVGDYGDIPEDIRKKISEDYYDLYLLDLRLLGSAEDEIYNANEFSGMKILRSIKSINVGNQVIIMTASNKAWNMKALLEAGADGYYIKESPELKLPKSFSEANYQSFSRDVRKVLSCGYKKTVYRQIKSLTQLILSSNKLENLADEIISTIASAQNQLQKAETDKDFAYSFLTLFQVLELLCRDFISPDKKNTWIVNFDTPLCYYNVDGQIPVKQDSILDEHPSIKRKITSIYIEVCSGTNCKFIRDNIFLDIDRRNAFVHKDASKLADSKISKVYQADGFIHLLSTIETILRMLL